MEETTLSLQHNVRVTYYAIRRLFEKDTQFSNIEYNDDLYIVEGRHGAWLNPFSEKVKMKVVATSSTSCKVVVESSSRTLLNLLNFGANKGNVQDLSDCISNEVYKLCQPGEIPMSNQGEDHSTIRIVKPTINIR